MNISLKMGAVALLAAFLWIMVGSATAQVTFKNVTPIIGTAFQVYPNCAAWGDIDNDGDLDVYTSQGSQMGNDLMINDLNGSGKFVRGDTLAGVFIRTAGPRSVLIVDIDNDGDQDIMAIADRTQTHLCLNQLMETGSLVFQDVSEAVGIAHVNEAYYCANLADFDNDGRLDIFLAGLSSTAWPPSLLYKNTMMPGGPLTFEDVTETSGIFSMMGMSIVCGAWADYDNDGDQDLLTPTSETWPVFFYRNEGNGVFTEISEENGLSASYGSCRAGLWADYDNDGDLDVYITRCLTADMPDVDTCELWRNDNGYFVEVPSARVDGKEIRGGAWGDYDNDGDLDLHLLDGSKVDIMFRNDGNDVFVDVVESVGLAKTEAAGGWGLMEIKDRGGQTFADWDADGDLDLFLPGDVGTKPYLMQNNGGNMNNWLEVRLTGVTSNRNGIGARVIAKAGDLRQIREVCMGSGYLCGPPTDCHFGLAKKTVVDSLIILWPSGAKDIYTGVAVNQLLKLTAGAGSTAVEKQEGTLPRRFTLGQNYPNPFNPTTEIVYEVPAAGRVRLEVYAVNGQWVTTLVDKVQPGGPYTARFDAGSLAGGVYFYRLITDQRVVQKKMILVK
ncbi:T9SS type A sorting domain-containing protein [bacterium]|nr:T9SS type A sorting domain-containing protein [bacterium]